jgi:phosphoglycerate kinase
MRSALPSAELAGKRVFIRADLNVPLIKGILVDDFRLRAVQPTLDLLIRKGARIILATHIGRPEAYTKELSTENLIPWFTEHGYTVTFAKTLSEAQTLSDTVAPGTILLLENLRFFKEEHNGSGEDQGAYAQKLRALADYYVNDAWALIHEDDVSITLLPELFTHKTIGLLIEKEMTELDKLRNPQRPYVMFLGGAKLSKLSFIEQALGMADTVIVLPALSFTFLKAQGVAVGDSLVDDSSLDLARKILSMAKERKVELVLPLDYLIGNKDLTGPVLISEAIPQGKIGISVGPASLERYTQIITNAKTIFYNGAMGFFERPETLEPLKKLLQSIAETNTYSVVGGGESVAAVNLFHIEGISFCSSGGGATTYYLIHGTAPGLRSIS